MPPSVCSKLDGAPFSGTPSESEELDWKVGQRKREDDEEQRCTDQHANLEENQKDPIHYLPVEVVSHIFTLCLPNITREGHKRNAVPLQLGAICQYWRRIAWSTPQLWNILFLNVTPSTASAVSQLLPEWLARSGKLPLFVSIAHDRLIEDSSAWDPTTHIVDTLRLYAKRWRVLKVHLPAFHLFRLSQSDYSALDTLLVNPTPTMYEAIDGTECAKKSPRYVSLRTRGWDINNFNWGNVIRLDLNGSELGQIWEILEQAPNLEDLELYFVMHQNFTSNIILNSLQKLRVDCSSLASFSLEHLSCPNLELFHWEFPESPLALANVITGWGCPLTDLAINTRSTLDDLFRLFNATPLLTRLSLQRRCLTNEFFERLHQPNTTTNPYLPRLRELRLLKEVDLDFQWSAVALLAPPMDHELGNGVCRPLSRIHIKLGRFLDEENIVIGKDDLITMLQMMNRGIELNIEATEWGAGYELSYNLLLHSARQILDSERRVS